MYILATWPQGKYFVHEENSMMIESIARFLCLQDVDTNMLCVDDAVDWCSTSYIYDETVDEEALLCPHGYVCQVDAAGDTQSGIPNRGRCVRKRHEPPSGL